MAGLSQNYRQDYRSLLIQLAIAGLLSQGLGAQTPIPAADSIKITSGLVECQVVAVRCHS